MKTRNIYYILLLFVVGVFSSCKEEAADTGEPYFTFKNAAETETPTEFSVDYLGNSTGTGEQYVIRSNKSWKIVPATENDWVRFFPSEGDKDGIVRLLVQENPTFEPRQMQFTYVVDGEDEPVVFTVNQAKAIPYITTSAPTGKSIDQSAQELSVTIKSNVEYTYTLESNWLTLISTSKKGLTRTLNFKATVNVSEDERTTDVAITSVTHPELNTTLSVIQDGVSILNEKFAWLKYGSAVFYTTTGETVFSNSTTGWTTAEKAKGWTSTLNPLSNDCPLYARQGFVKLGKTKYGGDLISPKLTAIIGTQDVVVKFKAVPYMTAGGTMDDNKLYVSVIGPGTVSQSLFIIDNWPNYTSDPSCTAIWSDAATQRSFTITGATSETQVKFLGGAYDLTTATINKNRIFLDDIKVVAKK